MTSKRPPITVVVVESAETIDIRAWARYYVAAVLEAEGISINPAAIANDSTGSGAPDGRSTKR